ncbi:MAG: hypothetical protein HGB23_06795 [Chlorobiaceae bacterium]|nr:hypothetical protein [Chlorobiaceae bacterium]
MVPALLDGCPLAFVSVSGSANGHYIISNYPNPFYIPTPSDPPPDFENPAPLADKMVKVNIGKSDVHVTVWYIPTGSAGGPGAYIDSFNVDTGEFFYDPKITNDFVTVSPDQGLTTVANDIGFVPTVSDETITSNANIQNVPFLNWTVLSSFGPGSKPVINGNNLKVGAQTFVVAIAFFGTENRHKLPLTFLEIYEATWHRLYPGEEVDAPKPHDPGPVWKNIFKQLAVLLAMQDSLNLVSRVSRAEIQSRIAVSVKTLTALINKKVQGTVK